MLNTLFLKRGGKVHKKQGNKVAKSLLSWKVAHASPRLS